MFSLERRLKRNLAAVFHYIKGHFIGDGARFFSEMQKEEKVAVSCSKGNSKGTYRKNSLQWEMIEHWSRLPRVTGNTILEGFHHSGYGIKTTGVHFVVYMISTGCF